jgi:hypothetical protein
MSCVVHQSLHQVGVDGEKPPGTRWYQCKACKRLVLMQLVAEYPVDQEVQIARRNNIKIEKYYTARDGSRHASIEKTVEYHKLLDEVAMISGFLAPRPPALEDGEGFVQQERDTVEEVKIRLRKLLAKEANIAPEKMDIDRYFGSIDFDDFNDFATVSATDPAGMHPAAILYYRLRCMDDKCREWQSPVIASLGGKEIQLNLLLEPHSEDPT